MYCKICTLDMQDGHAGCVNTVAFNDSGSILVSGSDDQQVILWDYCSGKDTAVCEANVCQSRQASTTYWHRQV